MKKNVVCLALTIALFAIPAFAADDDPASRSYEEPQMLHANAQETGNGTASEKPYVYFSDWESEPVSDRLNAYSRGITVSDGGNYLMTYLEISGDRYYFDYDAIYQGQGEQTVYSSDWSSEEIRIGKLFPFESMDECDLDIDQIITDHISVRESNGASFILVFRPNGGKYDGTVQTVTVMNGRRDLTADSYAETESIELLGAFRFPEEDRSALHFGDNIIQPDSTGFQIQMVVIADVNDGIALMVYTNASGNEVCVAQPVIDGYGVLTAYDSADSVEEITVGHFGIMGFSHSCTEALFEGVDFETVREGKHSITLEGDVFVDCPDSADPGEIVTVHTGEAADGEIIVEMNGVRIAKTDWGTFAFMMPDEDVVLRGWISTAGFSGA